MYFHHNSMMIFSLLNPDLMTYSFIFFFLHDDFWSLSPLRNIFRHTENDDSWNEEIEMSSWRKEWREQKG